MIPPAWTKLVWHQLAIPKCSFTLWLALKDRLLTKERMHRFGMHTDLSCMLCNNAIESNEHLFSSCTYTVEVMTDQSFPFTMNWMSYLNAQVTLGSFTHTKTLLAYTFLAVAMFYIWKERNERLHTPGHHRTAACLHFLIKRTLREKVCTNRSFQKAAAKDQTLILSLY